MKLKDIAFVTIIVILVTKILFFSADKATKSLQEENKALTDLIALSIKTIDSLNIAQAVETKQIDSLIDLRNVIKIKYKTIYEEYTTKDSLVNSLSVDSIVGLWTKRYSYYQTK